MFLSHGGNVFEVAKELNIYPNQLIDLSSNINPLGPPKGFFRFLRKYLKEVVYLPEVLSESAILLLAEKHKVLKENILVGHGATEFIYTIPKVFTPKKSFNHKPNIC